MRDNCYVDREFILLLQGCAVWLGDCSIHLAIR